MTLLNPARHATPFAFFRAASKSEFKWIGLNLVLYALGSVSVLAASYFLGRTIDALTLHTGEPLALFITGIIIGVICHEVFYRLGHICEVFVTARVRERTKKTLFDHTTSLSFGYFADRFAGEIAHKIAVTADAFERLIVITTNYIVENTILITVSAIMLGFVHPWFGWFMAGWAVVFVAGEVLLARQMHVRASRYAEMEAKTTGAFVDTYANISVVKVYGHERSGMSARRQVEAEKKAFVNLGAWDILMFHYQGISIILLSLGFLLITGNLYGQNLITVGQIVFVASATLRLFEIIWGMGKQIADFIRFRGESYQNLKDLVVAPSIIDGAHEAPTHAENVNVKYDEVSFAYNPGQPVLERFSFEIRSGEKVGIVGLSGAGKTTFAHLLLRFFDPQKGKILLNGKDIQNFSQEYLRAHISYISQDTSLFHATIAENIAYGSAAASEEDIARAARLAYVDDFIAGLPQGYESVVGERGVKLSGGQRQRIAIARAILADRPLFLLDEATSALDSESESKIQQGLATLIERKTVIAIAHRLSTLSRMDRIIFMEDGRIVEDGTHETLLTQQGKYAALWHLQAGGFLPSISKI